MHIKFIESSNDQKNYIVEPVNWTTVWAYLLFEQRSKQRKWVFDWPGSFE